MAESQTPAMGNGRPGPKRPVTFRVFRSRSGDGGQPRFDTFQVEVDPRMTVLDALEDIRTSQDPTLLYRHSCHHASCGTCAVKVNHRDVLSCVTNVLELGTDVVTVEPLAVLPLAADLVVDMTPLAEDISPAGLKTLRLSEYNAGAVSPEGIPAYQRFENCIECGACVSACPITNTDPGFMGPAGLAAVYRALLKGDTLPDKLYALADCEHGAWRCHTGWECTSVCPSNVDPAGLLTALRRRVLVYKVRRLFGMGA